MMFEPIGLAGIVIIMLFLAQIAEAIVSTISSKNNGCDKERLGQLESKMEEMGRMVDSLKQEQASVKNEGSKT